MEIIMIRHGETDSNLENRYVGWTDVPLNITGIAQVKSACLKLKDLRADSIYCSPLLRAKETAKIIQESMGGTIHYEDALRERNFGVFENLTNKEISTIHKELYEEWSKNWVDFKIPIGESATEMYERNRKFLHSILNFEKSQTIILVTHLGTIRNLVAEILGLGIEKIWHFKFANASITKIEWTDQYPVITLLNG